MSSYETFFRGKRVTLMGLGLLGRGVGDAEFIARCGAQVLATDKKSEAELAPSVERLRSVPNTTFHLGGHRIEDFTDCDMVIKAAGVPLDSPEIAAAKAAGIPVYMSTALFAQFAAEAGATLIGVTGTRGKTTTSQMIVALLRAAGRRVHLGGNVRGLSTLAMIPDIRAGDLVVLELDSWQLQGFGDLKLSPHIAVFTSFHQDHLNYYHNDTKAYLRDKMQIFAHQRPEDLVIFTMQSASIAWDHAAEIRGRMQIVDGHERQGDERYVHLPGDWHLGVPGVHNRANAGCALAVARELAVPDDVSKRALESFEAVEGRLQFMREVRGVRIYNDNNSTTNVATENALWALNPDKTKRILLIMGGSDKGVSFGEFLKIVREHTAGLFLLAGSGTDRIREYFADAPVFDSLERAFSSAMNAARAGDIVLFSPAFASFGMFKNEYDRNDQFMRLVQAL